MRQPQSSATMRTRTVSTTVLQRGPVHAAADAGMKVPSTVTVDGFSNFHYYSVRHPDRKPKTNNHDEKHDDTR